MMTRPSQISSEADANLKQNTTKQVAQNVSAQPPVIETTQHPPVVYNQEPGFRSVAARPAETIQPPPALLGGLVAAPDGSMHQPQLDGFSGYVQQYSSTGGPPIPGATRQSSDNFQMTPNIATIETNATRTPPPGDTGGSGRAGDLSQHPQLHCTLQYPASSHSRMHWSGTLQPNSYCVASCAGGGALDIDGQSHDPVGNCGNYTARIQSVDCIDEGGRSVCYDIYGESATNMPNAISYKNITCMRRPVACATSS